MKRIFTFLAVLFASLALVSCNKDGAVMSFYEYQSDSFTITGNTSTTNVAVINNALAPRLQANNNMYQISDSQAVAEWNSFVSSVDDSKVVFGTDSEFYTVSFVKVNVNEKGEFESESVIVKTVGTKTWKKSGAK